jgi:hypothetical protein
METKKEFKYFTIFQYEQEQEYLSRRYQEGWKYVKITGLGIYHFERCQPEKVIYQLDYNQEGLANKEEYVRMFADCGWEYLMTFAGYSYFRKPAAEMNGEEEIFCDDQSKLEMMERVLKGRMTPLLILFCTVLLPQCVMNFTIYHNYVLAVMYALILAVYVIVFIACGKKYRQLKNGE